MFRVSAASVTFLHWLHSIWQFSVAVKQNHCHSVLVPVFSEEVGWEWLSMPILESEGDVWPGQMNGMSWECPHGPRYKKKKETNCDQMMWELELNKLCFGACLATNALQTPVLGKFCVCNHGSGHLGWLQKKYKWRKVHDFLRCL